MLKQLLSDGRMSFCTRKCEDYYCCNFDNYLLVWKRCCHAAPASSTCVWLLPCYPWSPVIPLSLKSKSPPAAAAAALSAMANELRVINSTLMVRHGPGRRKTSTSDLFCTAPAENCQFRSLMFIFNADQLTATLPWQCASWTTSSWRYPVAVDKNILTNAGFFWKKNPTLYYLKTDNSMQEINHLLYSSWGFFPLLFTLKSKKRRTEAWAKHLTPHLSSPALVLRTILHHSL